MAFRKFQRVAIQAYCHDGRYDLCSHRDVSITGSTLEKNSESANLEFLLTPDGTFRNYVRLTNTSNVQGSNLMVTLINDAGDQVSFSLSDAGVSDELAPRASTPLININALYEAAQAVDRGMDADDMPIADVYSRQVENMATS